MLRHLKTRPVSVQDPGFFDPFEMEAELRDGIAILEEESARMVWQELIDAGEPVDPAHLAVDHWSRLGRVIGPDWATAQSRWLWGVEDTSQLLPVAESLRNELVWPEDTQVIYFDRSFVAVSSWGVFLAAWPNFLWNLGIGNRSLIASYGRPEFLAWHWRAASQAETHTGLRPTA